MLLCEEIVHPDLYVFTGSPIRISSYKSPPANRECEKKKKNSSSISMCFEDVYDWLILFLHSSLIKLIFFSDSFIWCQSSPIPGSHATSPGPAHTDKPGLHITLLKFNKSCTENYFSNWKWQLIWLCRKCHLCESRNT